MPSEHVAGNDSGNVPGNGSGNVFIWYDFSINAISGKINSFFLFWRFSHFLFGVFGENV